MVQGNIVAMQIFNVDGRQDSKDATRQSPRHPPQPLEEAANTLSGKDTSDDGRVVRGSSRPKNDGSGGRFYFNVTGFPFPLGPLFARQTVRSEVIKQLADTVNLRLM